MEKPSIEANLYKLDSSSSDLDLIFRVAQRKRIFIGSHIDGKLSDSRQVLNDCEY